MKAMIFAAGRGERMGELTRHKPKPLLEVGGKPLIEYHLRALAATGISEVVVNLAYLGEQIETLLGSGEGFGLRIRYSREPYPLETAGGILHALDLLGDEPFLLVNADVWTDFPFQTLLNHRLDDRDLGHLVMVPNPEHVAKGNFLLADNGRLADEADIPEHQRFTYSGIALLRPALVADYPERREAFPLGEVFRWAMAAGRLSGELYRGQWRDIGTPERLQQLERELHG